MTIRIAINGLGRIGRCVIRALDEYALWDTVELVAANGPAELSAHAHLLRYDSVHGRFAAEVREEGDHLVIAGRRTQNVRITHEKDIAKLDWKALGVDYVLECTGKFTKRADAAQHLARGAKGVLISAPSPDADATIVHGVNDAALKPADTVVSVGSCTTNGLAPVAKTLNDAVGIVSGFMTTIHSYTGDQNLVDGSHKDLRRARAAALSMVPSTTGAAKALGLVLPELAGKLDGTSVRVPTPNVSLVDLTFVAARDTTRDEINTALTASATGAMKGILAVSTEPLVSIDFTHHPASSIADLSGTFVTGNRLVRVAAWYDNEWGFSCRMLDVLKLMAGRGMTAFRTLDDLDLSGKTVLVRVDLNVPMQAGRVSDATRIRRVAATLQEIMDKGGRAVALSHFDRPKGRYVPGMSLAPLVDVLGAAVGTADIRFGVDCVGPEARAAIDQTRMGGVVLMENLRFHAGEEANDPAFADQLAELGDVFVSDAFSCAHRAHASVVGLAERLPSVAGRLMQAELEALTRAFAAPERPLLALVGGSKVSTKLELLGNIVGKVDMLVIGGAMANTFLHAQGFDVGASLVEREMADTARAILAAAEKHNCRILLPVDVTAASAFKTRAPCRVVPVDAIPEGHLILDVGPRSCAALATAIDEARTLVWNGPLGAFETSPFDAGTVTVARAAAANTRAGTLMSVAGGGDTVAALCHAGVMEEFSYVSTAGGAFLEWLEGKTLPGVAVLMERVAA